MRKYTISPIVLFFIIILSPLVTKSCANTSTPPSGGPKDTLPPILVATVPQYNALHHPTDVKHSSVTFQFNEYVVLKDASSNIYLSPPQKKVPTAKIKGKKVIVSFDQPLDSNTTYSLDLGSSIVDNNEGTKFPKYNFSFSTGDHIDSLFVSGTVVDAKTMLAKKNITILFHTDPSDSAVYNVLPKASAKSDVWGFFAVRNLPADSYRVFALDDQNNNNKYDPADEMIAFLDTLVVPRKVMTSGMLELAIMDEKDTALCMSRPSDLRLYLFKETSSRQFLKNKGRPTKRMCYITFAAPYPKIDSLAFNCYADSNIITQFNTTKDSLAIWINDQKAVPDTMLLTVKYLKTDDSLKILVPQTEIIKMNAPKPKLVKDKRGNAVEFIDTIAHYKVTAEPSNIEQDGFIIEFDNPLIIAPWDSVKLKCITTKQLVKYEEFTVEQDSTNIRRYVIKAKKPLLLGNEYILKLPHRQFFDIDGLPCDSLEKKVSIPNDDKLSSLTLEMVHVNGHYIVELINEKRDKVLRSFRIKEDCKLLFPYLSKGKYSVRITQDNNGNGLIDTGSILDKREPEKVILFKFGTSLGNEAYLLDLPERMDLEQTIDLQEVLK